MLNWRSSVGVFLLGSLFLTGCIQQFDPRPSWKVFREEHKSAVRPIARLTADGKIPEHQVAVEGDEGDPIDKKYANFCASCHGVDGKGDGAAGASLNPKPRNFVDWNEDVSDEYIAKVIREGGTAVGKSASMAPWSGVLNPEEITAMVAKVRSFRK